MRYFYITSSQASPSAPADFLLKTMATVLQLRLFWKPTALLVVWFESPCECQRRHRQRSSFKSTLDRLLEHRANRGAVKNTPLKNRFPETFIDKELARLCGKKGKQRAVQSEKDNSYSTTVLIPFVDKTTQAIQCVLRPHRIHVVGRPCQWK